LLKVQLIFKGTKSSAITENAFGPSPIAKCLRYDESTKIAINAPDGEFPKPPKTTYRIEGKTENREIILKGKAGYLSLKKNRGKSQEKIS
jgi:hypothetical protein